MKTYLALIRKEESSSYGADFPDFPGCITAGEGLDEAYNTAPEVLQFHIDGMLADGEEIPEPTSLDDIMADPHNEVAVPVPVQVPEEKTKRINITITVRLVEGHPSKDTRFQMRRKILSFCDSG